MKYIFYYEVLNGNNYKNIDLLVGKTKKAYLIGPKITDSFDYDSFIKRIKSNCIYKINIYKKRINKKKLNALIDVYCPLLKENEIYEIERNKVKIHKIIPVPGDNYEKK
mgnify:CR=1 FL=1